MKWPSKINWMFYCLFTSCQLVKTDFRFLPLPTGWSPECQRPVDSSERGVADRTLQPRCHGDAEMLHVVGGKLQGHHPARRAPSTQTGTADGSKKHFWKITVYFTTCHVFCYTIWTQLDWKPESRLMGGKKNKTLSEVNDILRSWEVLKLHFGNSWKKGSEVYISGLAGMMVAQSSYSTVLQ